MDELQFRSLMIVVVVAGIFAILLVLAVMDFVIILKNDYADLLKQVNELQRRLKERRYI